MTDAYKHMKPGSDPSGFTLIELLVALGISSIILALVSQLFISTNEINTVQEEVAAVQQDIRAAMDIMATDILMTGLDPSGTATDEGFQNNGNDDDDTDMNSVALKYDYDGDGTCETDRCYFFDANAETLKIRPDSVSGLESLTKDGTIASVRFSYALADGSVDTAPDDNLNLDKIRIVTVTVCGKISGTYRSKYPGTYCFSKDIKPRNM